MIRVSEGSPPTIDKPGESVQMNESASGLPGILKVSLNIELQTVSKGRIVIDEDSVDWRPQKSLTVTVIVHSKVSGSVVSGMNRVELSFAFRKVQLGQFVDHR